MEGWKVLSFQLKKHKIIVIQWLKGPDDFMIDVQKHAVHRQSDSLSVGQSVARSLTHSLTHACTQMFCTVNGKQHKLIT